MGRGGHPLLPVDHQTARHEQPGGSIAREDAQFESKTLPNKMPRSRFGPKIICVSSLRVNCSTRKPVGLGNLITISIISGDRAEVDAAATHDEHLPIPPRLRRHRKLTTTPATETHFPARPWVKSCLQLNTFRGICNRLRQGEPRMIQMPAPCLHHISSLQAV